MRITEDIVGFRPGEYFEYATRNGSLPVDDFGGELSFADRDGGLLVRYRGGFNAKYPGTGSLLRALMRWRQRSVLQSLGTAYEARYRT